MSLQEAEGEQQPGEERKPAQPAAPGTRPNKAIKVSPGSGTGSGGPRLLWLLGPRGSEPPQRWARGIRWKNKWLVAANMLEAATGGQQVLRRRPGGSGPGQPGCASRGCGAFRGQSGRKGCSELGCSAVSAGNLLWALFRLCKSSSEGKPTCHRTCGKV